MLPGPFKVEEEEEESRLTPKARWFRYAEHRSGASYDHSPDIPRAWWQRREQTVDVNVDAGHNLSCFLLKRSSEALH